MRRPALALALLLGVVGATTQHGSTSSSALPSAGTAVHRSASVNGAMVASTGYTVTAGGLITAVRPTLRGMLLLKVVRARFGDGLPVVCTPNTITVINVVTGLREGTYTCLGFLEDADRPRPLTITVS